MKRPALLILLFCLPLLSMGQQSLFEVKKSFNKKVDWEENYRLEVSAVKAEIYLESHASPHLEYNVEILAKHPDKKQAQEDIEKMEFISDKVARVFYLRNYLNLNREENKPQSGIKVIYRIKVPEGCKIKVKDKFGKVFLNDMQAEIELISEYSPVDCKNVSGIVNIRSLYSDVEATNLNAVLDLNLNRSNLNLTTFRGSFQLKAILSEISISDFSIDDDMDIKAERSKINLAVRDKKLYDLSLDLYNSEWTNLLGSEFEYNSQEDKNVSANTTNNSKQAINISLETGSLTLKRDHNE